LLAAWNAGAYTKVIAHLSGKVSGIANLFDLVRRDAFQVCLAGRSHTTGTGMGRQTDPPSKTTVTRVESTPPHNGKPVWYAADYTLWYGEVIVRHFPRIAPKQHAILERFEREGWPEGAIEAPFDGPTLKNTIDNLNAGLDSDSPIIIKRIGQNRMRWVRREVA
jgi:hypothetical protein